MDVDKNLFLYNLAVVSIMKNEGPYVKEWLDYHLLAGVDHFFIYNNDSEDNQSEVIQPYIDAGLVTYIDYPGKARQYEAYNAAARDYKFLCRYMAFIDGDEFIFPKIADTIIEVVDEILADKPNAAALAVNIFGFDSNYQDKADYTKGLLERFTRRASVENTPIIEEKGLHGGVAHVSSITNPRRIEFFCNPHFAVYFKPYSAVNENGGKVELFSNYPPTVEKIVMYHYPTKSREEYINKINRGTADAYYNVYKISKFSHEKDNDVFDDNILKYRDALEDLFLHNGEDIIETFGERNFPNYERLLQAISQNLLPGFVEEDTKKFFDNAQNRFEYFDILVNFFSVAPKEFFEEKTATFLTCLAVSTFLKDNFVDEELGNLFEEFSLNYLNKQLEIGVTPFEIQLLVRELPKILAMPYPAVNDIRSTCLKLIPQLMNTYRIYDPNAWREFVHMDYVLNLLKVFDGYNNK